MTTATPTHGTTQATTQAERDEALRLGHATHVDEMRLDPTADQPRRRLRDRLDAARLLPAPAHGETAGALRVRVGKDGPLDRELVETHETERLGGAVPEAAVSVLTRFGIEPEHGGGSFAHDLLRRHIELDAEEGGELPFLDRVPYLVNDYTGLGWSPSRALAAKLARGASPLRTWARLA